MKLIISGVNIDSGGPLSIYKECLLELTKSEYDVIALVYDRNLFQEFDNIKIIEVKNAKKNYLLRFFYEYIYFYFLSLKLKPDIWLSLHDMTPNVRVGVRAVYCHNPSPFYKMTDSEKKLDRKMWIFNRFYGFIYKINLLKNDFVVVQQNWVADRFVMEYKVNRNKIIVAKPEVKSENIDLCQSVARDFEKAIFFYPAFPRSFKNFEIICEATRELIKRGYVNFEVILTISGAENRYSSYLFDKYKDIPNINFIGLLNRKQVFNYYESSACLIFPSKLETWGLPISEYIIFNKPILVVDLPYAKETVGNYSKVAYFKSDDIYALSNLMVDVLEKKIINTSPTKFVNKYINANSWGKLFSVLTKV